MYSTGSKRSSGWGNKRAVIKTQRLKRDDENGEAENTEEGLWDDRSLIPDTHICAIGVKYVDTLEDL